MMRGTVTPDREAVLQIRLRGPSRNEHTLTAVLDTGFNDFLTIPTVLADQLGLPLEGSTEAELADGQVALLDYYSAEVESNGRFVPILVLAADGGSLIGMSLLYGHQVSLQVIDGGDVVIEALF